MVSPQFLSNREPTENERKISKLAAEKLVEWIEQFTGKKVNSEDLHLESISATFWRNGALGAPERGGRYTMAIVGGYKIVFALGDEVYSVHSNGSGRRLVSPQFLEHPLPRKFPMITLYR